MAQVDTALESISREILIGNQWAKFREEFRLAFVRRFQGTVGRGKTAMTSAKKPQIPGTWTNSIRELSKFRRHCYESLAKWLLSQKAREPRPADRSTDFFFPATQDVYNKQLVRDLTLKCSEHRHQDPKFQADVEKFVADYRLGERCAKMKHAVVEALKQQKADRSPFVVESVSAILSKPADNETHRVEGHRRDIKIKIAEPHQSSVDNSLVYSLNNLFIPNVAWEKLRASFAKFSPEIASDETLTDEQKEHIFAIRAATVVLRYEVNLMSGSLQLCADNTLKRHLAASGYHVLDLCASPINAYMSTPQVFSLTSNGDGGVSLEAPQPDQLRPNNFCSAFYDTDSFFGSLGSALQIDTAELAKSMDEGPVEITCGQGGKLVLTLDVPYDEDLCELLFLKLKEDIAKVESNPDVANRIVWLLVLPLWWNLQFEHTKKQVIGASDDEMATIIARNANYLKRGYQLEYKWPEVLCSSNWALFDSVFVSKQYTYYCSSTNKLLAGVTETEVVGMQIPTSDGDENGNIATHLKNFYDNQLRGMSQDSSDEKKRKRGEADTGAVERTADAAGQQKKPQDGQEEVAAKAE